MELNWTLPLKLNLLNARKYDYIAVLCIREVWHKSPTMKSVIEVYDNVTNTLSKNTLGKYRQCGSVVWASSDYKALSTPPMQYSAISASSMVSPHIITRQNIVIRFNLKTTRRGRWCVLFNAFGGKLGLLFHILNGQQWLIFYILAMNRTHHARCT